MKYRRIALLCACLRFPAGMIPLNSIQSGGGCIQCGRGVAYQM